MIAESIKGLGDQDLINLMRILNDVLMYFWCFGFRGELGFLNCDDIFMYVVYKQFELLEFVFV